jgi:hypothetical protein
MDNIPNARLGPVEWRIRSRSIDLVVNAVTQSEAWDTLCDRPADDFGLIVTALGPNGERMGIQTEMLMRKWNRLEDAGAFHEAARAAGLVS